MVPCKYNDHGVTRTFDLRTAVRVAEGTSAAHPGWSATIVYDPASKAFIELSSGPQDVRGNGPDAADRVDVAHVLGNFGVSEQLTSSYISTHLTTHSSGRATRAAKFKR
jgi:hypothetical protein